MQYLGGKTRVAKHIAAEIDKVRQPGQLVWDAFCGGLSVSRALLKNGPVLSTDACAPLIALYRAVQNGWDPPTHVDEATYRAARTLPDSDPMKAFCGFGCSFGGKWFGGYAAPNPHPGRAPYATNARKNLKANTVGLRFGYLDFFSEVPRALGIVLYLDPPYRATTGYAGAPPFDSDAFTRRVQQWADAGNPVFVSEYQLPIGQCIWQREQLTKVNCGLRAQGKKAIERLFYIAPKATAADSTHETTAVQEETET
jgi:DNA adenine methylase